MEKKTEDVELDALTIMAEDFSKALAGSRAAYAGAVKRVNKLEREMAADADAGELFHFDVLKRYTTLLNYRKVIGERRDELRTELKDVNARIDEYMTCRGLKTEDGSGEPCGREGDEN